MTRNEFYANDGKRISYLKWDNVENPVGVIQVSHGMVEHAGRYDLFAREMNKKGFIVVADDHRAHGVTDKDHLGYSEGDIWEKTLEDINKLFEIVRAEYRMPVILVGHSYGSFLTQAYIRRYYGHAGAVIGGSNYLAGPTVFFGRLVALWCKKFKGADKPAYLLKEKSFDAYDKKLGNGSFISSIPEECERYKQDEFCNFICSNNFYASFFNGARKLYDKNGSSLKGFPVLLLAGEDDPVGDMGKGVKKLEKWYKDHGADVSCVLYKGVRHEFLNDTSREDAFNRIADFALKCVEARKH